MAYYLLLVITSSICLILSATFWRTLYIKNQPLRKKSPQSKSHLVAILGSGGHTAEMVSLLRHVDPTRYIHRTYIVSSGDDFSCGKALEIERIIQKQAHPHGPIERGTWNEVTGVWDVKIVPRARKIHQKIYSTPFSASWCAFECFRALRSIAKTSKAAPGQYPDVIIANGPATSAILILVAATLRFLGTAPFWTLKTIYVESWARVNSLSLSGKLLLNIGACDRFFVQWEMLANRLNKQGVKKVEWKGFLVE